MELTAILCLLDYTLLPNDLKLTSTEQDVIQNVSTGVFS